MKRPNYASQEPYVGFFHSPSNKADRDEAERRPLPEGVEHRRSRGVDLFLAEIAKLPKYNHSLTLDAKGLHFYIEEPQGSPVSKYVAVIVLTLPDRLRHNGPSGYGFGPTRAAAIRGAVDMVQAEQKKVRSKADRLSVACSDAQDDIDRVGFAARRKE